MGSTFVSGASRKPFVASPLTVRGIPSHEPHRLRGALRSIRAQAHQCTHLAHAHHRYLDSHHCRSTRQVRTTMTPEAVSPAPTGLRSPEGVRAWRTERGLSLRKLAKLLD